MRTLFISAILALLVVSALAEQAKQPRTCRILVLAGAGTVPKTLHLFDGVDCQQVELPRMNLSPVYQIAPGPVSLRMLGKPLPESGLAPEGAPAVNLAQDLQHIYLLVTLDRSNPIAPVKLAVVNANHENIGRGEILWFNLTDKTVAGKLGSRTLRLGPGKRELLKEPTRGSEDYPVQLYFKMPGDDFPHPLCETLWRHDPRSRFLAFVVADGRRRVPRVFTYSDYREPEKPAANDENP